MVNNAFGPPIPANQSWGLSFDCSASGALLIYRRAANAAAAATNNIASFLNTGDLTIVGAVATKASGTTWANPSDVRMKRDVADCGIGLEAITQLRPVSFYYNGRFGGVDDGTLHYGFIADEVETVMPECVSTRDYFAPGPDNPVAEPVKTLDQSNIILGLVN